jgi:hypothetical protein
MIHKLQKYWKASNRLHSNTAQQSRARPAAAAEPFRWTVDHSLQ